MQVMKLSDANRDSLSSKFDFQIAPTFLESFLMPSSCRNQILKVCSKLQGVSFIPENKHFSQIKTFRHPQLLQVRTIDCLCFQGTSLWFHSPGQWYPDRAGGSGRVDHADGAGRDGAVEGGGLAPGQHQAQPRAFVSVCNRNGQVGVQASLKRSNPSYQLPLPFTLL